MEQLRNLEQFVDHFLLRQGIQRTVFVGVPCVLCVASSRFKTVRQFFRVGYAVDAFPFIGCFNFIVFVVATALLCRCILPILVG